MQLAFSYTLFEGLIKIFSPKNALIWLLISIVLIIFAIFPHVAEWLAMAFGFETTSNFLLSVAVIVLLIMEIKILC